MVFVLVLKQVNVSKHGKILSYMLITVSIIRPGRSRHLEFEEKDSTGHLIETFSKYPDQVV